MKTLTLDQLAQSEFVLSQNTSLQVTGGEAGPGLPSSVKEWIRDILAPIIADRATEGHKAIVGYLHSVTITAPAIDCSDQSMSLDIMTGCHY
ncbi:MAG TPA: hypothetical protein PLO56_07320 [Rhodothermales bacterium]|nr:hypothetical protein [Rhodothermales bacterium]